MSNLQELNEELAGNERIFKSPPLTLELVRAIKLISPQFDLTTNEKSREFWEADQNGCCWGEYNALASLFHAMPKPSKILEIGPGMGRSLVFFSKKLGLVDAMVHAYEGEGVTTRYTTLGPRFRDSFCGNLAMLRYVLEFNAINNVKIFNANAIELSGLPGPYDFLYSFYGIGFHWSLEYFLADILRLMDDHSVAVFTIPIFFTPFPGLNKLSYRIIEWKTVWPKDLWLKMLIIGKKSLPNFETIRKN